MQINLGQLLLQVINFGLLAAILTKFLYKPIVKTLEERNLKIDQGLKAAEANLLETAKLEEAKHQALIAAETQATQVLEQARRQAQKAAQDTINQAKEAAKIEAQKEYQLFQDQLEEEQRRLKTEIAQLVIATTKAALSGSLTPTQQRQILSHQLTQLKHYAKPQKS